MSDSLTSSPPSTCRHLNRLAEAVVGTIDQDADRTAAGAHFAEGDFLLVPRPATLRKLSKCCSGDVSWNYERRRVDKRKREDASSGK